MFAKLVLLNTIKPIFDWQFKFTGVLDKYYVEHVKEMPNPSFTTPKQEWR